MNVETAAVCSVDEARRITDQIRNTVEQVWNLLLEAHEKRAWTALGYSRWEDYVSSEFNMSRSHSYRLLDQAQVIREIKSVSPSGDIVIGEAEARDIKQALPQVVTHIASRVKANPDVPPAQIVREVVEETRAQVVDLRPKGSSRVAAVREHFRAEAATRPPGDGAGPARKSLPDGTYRLLKSTPEDNANRLLLNITRLLRAQAVISEAYKMADFTFLDPAIAQDCVDAIDASVDDLVAFKSIIRAYVPPVDPVDIESPVASPVKAGPRRMRRGGAD